MAASTISQTLESILQKSDLFLLAGPCVVESEELCLNVAENLKETTDKLGIPYVFKASYRKANRTKTDSFTGIGDEKALRILEKVKREFELPIVTDVHESQEVGQVAEVADILQIPAFLFRQTALLEAAARSGKIVNIKKGQFAAAEAMKFAAQKIEHEKNSNIILTERGNMFGYGDMIVDYRNIYWMKQLGYPVVMDCTHALQQPNNSTGVTGGIPELIEPIAKAAVACGADGLFLETHPDPSVAMSDGANMIELAKVEDLLLKLLRIRSALD
ncbi:MAG: 3-deoxy-8-phosphooctulonate synthase [Bacteroidia bacterium]